MKKFVYLKEKQAPAYPTGRRFSLDDFYYIRETARVINEVFPKDKILLVVRGHSGSILAGGIAYLLTRKGMDVVIAISRKVENSHSRSLEGVTIHKEDSKIIIIDDFIESGDTIYNIINDLKQIKNIGHFDMLCVSNHWDEKRIEKSKHQEIYEDIISHFDYICCNEPKN